MSVLVRRRVLVTGRVQGVWFRQFTCEQGRARSLAGWVRNNPDGTVEAVAEGPRDAVDGWLAALHEGPPLARVLSVDVRDEPASSPLGEFRVVR